MQGTRQQCFCGQGWGYRARLRPGVTTCSCIRGLLALARKKRRRAASVGGSDIAATPHDPVTSQETRPRFLAALAARPPIKDWLRR
jgi:hypothetical protein